MKIGRGKIYRTNRRLTVILFIGGTVVFLVGAMLSLQEKWGRREEELLERIAKLYDLMGQSSNWVDQARAKGLVRKEDLPIIVRWIGRGYRADWLQKIEEVSRRLNQDEYFSGDHSLRATYGFAVLGTNAAPAIPAMLNFLRYGKNLEPAVTALGSIGEPVWDTAREFVSSKSANERMIGAYLLGILRMREEESVPALLRLINDEESAVKASALVALAEFPCQETIELFGKMLRSDDRAKVEAGAYGLHRGGRESMRLLVDKFESTTNRWVHGTVLRAVYAREHIWRARNNGSPPSWEYQMRWGFCFSASHNLASMIVDEGEGVKVMGKVREKLLNGEETDLEKEYRHDRSNGCFPEEAMNP